MKIDEAIESLNEHFRCCDEITAHEEESWVSIKNAITDARWIPVSERLPERNQPVLITDGKTVGLTLFYQSPKDFVRVTHWMPLPEPPEQEVE